MALMSRTSILYDKPVYIYAICYMPYDALRITLRTILLYICCPTGFGFHILYSLKVSLYCQTIYRYS